MPVERKISSGDPPVVGLTRRELLRMPLAAVATRVFGREGERHETAEGDQFRDFIEKLRTALSNRDSATLASFTHPTKFRWGLSNTDIVVQLSPQQASRFWVDALRDKHPLCARYYDLDWRARLLFGENPALFFLGLRQLTQGGGGTFLGTMLFFTRENNKWYIKNVSELTRSGYESYQKWYDLWKDCNNIALPPEYGATVFLEPQRRLAFITGLTSSFSPGPEGVVTGEIFDDFQLESRKLGYGAQDFINVSWGGGRFDKRNGMFYPEEQKCEDTLQPVDDRARMLAQDVVGFFAQYPNDKLPILTHSEGIQPTIRMMEMAKNEEFFLGPYIARIKIIATHGPVLGINAPGLEAIARLLPIGCRVGPSPAPGALASPAGENLLRTWNRRHQRSREIKEVVEWWEARFGKVISIGNLQDNILSPVWGSLPRAFWEKVLDQGWPIPEEIATQNIPGGERHLHIFGIGHDRIWKTEEGLALLSQLVGRQEEVVNAPSWKGVVPGRTTQSELSSLLGNPEIVRRDDSRTVLYFPREGGGPSHEVTVENNLVGLIIEKVLGGNISLYRSRYGNPEGEYWGPQKDARFKTYVYPSRGLAVVARPESGVVFEVWYFEPMTLESLLGTWGKDFVLEYRRPQQF